MSFLHPKSGRRTNEDIYFAYYSRLLEWASQITHNDRAGAEDLVHDFYLRISRITRPIDDIEQLEPYLFKVLRNLYYARVRRAGHDPLNDLTIVDYDSVEQGLAVADRRELLFARDHLRQICRYACERKSTVRSASVLILRFFHGYYPTELKKILQTSRSSVDKLLQVARGEARFHLERPEVLRSILPAAKPLVSFARKGEDTHQLFSELQRAIFSATDGECFDQASLGCRYAVDAINTGLTTQELSHLVSCRTCLESVNTILHLPSLEERSPEDGTDRNGPGNDSSSRITSINHRSSKTGPSVRKLERRARELFEHRPARLQIAIDGEVRTSQKVAAEINELHLKLAQKERPSFIEILSEQGFCLAYLDVEEPTLPGRLEQKEALTLSDNRSLTLTLTFDTELPIVHVVYRDPVILEDASAESSALHAQPAKAVAGPRFDMVSAAKRSPFVFIAAGIRSKIKQALPDMNPTLATAIVFAVVSVLYFFLWWHQLPRISPHALLAQAESWDAPQQKSVSPGVIYQKVQIKTPKRILERALYRDVQGIRVPHRQKLSAADSQLKDRLAQAGVDWNAPLSPTSYQDWHDRQQLRQDSITRTGNHLLKLTTTVSGGSVAQASLTVRDIDFHPVERTVELRDEGTIVIAELNYDVIPWAVFNQDWFEPLASKAITDVPSVHAVMHMPHVISNLELDEAELTARATLNRLHADTGESIQLTRGPAGIDIKGVVDTDDRKHELLSQLALLPNVHSSILSEEEVAARPPSPSTFSSGRPVEVYSLEAQPSPLEQYLREKRLATDQLSTISHNLLYESVRISQVEVHFSELQARFKEVNQLPMDVQSHLVTLSNSYLGTIEAGLDANKRNLLPLGFDNADQKTAVPETSDPDGDLDEQVRRYHQLCLELISNGTGQSRPAAAIAGELIDTGERIRLLLARMSATIPGNHN